jgi:hypothetical protein
MKKFTQILILSIFTILMIGGFAKSAFADAPLIVHFQNEPQHLFNEANFAPGNEITRTIGVSNNSGSSQNIIVEATNALDTGGLGDKLNLVIKEGDIIRYNDTLGKFLRAGEVSLSPLSNISNTTYSFGVTFDTGADDNLQNKTLGFDLCVGFQGGTTQCGNTVISGENGGNTGGSTISGSNGGTITLIISNEQALNISNVGQTGSATIIWDTNKLSTSQVIYGVSSGSYNLDLNILPNLGYPLGSVEDGNKVMNHSVTLSGLTPGATYVYRVVSRASPATVSYEHQFTVPLLAENNNPILNNNNNNLNNAGQVLGAQNNPSDIGINNDGELDTTENAGNLNNQGGNLLGASAGNIMGLPNLSFWALLVALLLLIILVVRIIYRRRKTS